MRIFSAENLHTVRMSEDIWDPEHDWILQFEKLLNPSKPAKTCHKHYEKITHQSSDLDDSKCFRVR